MSILNQFNLAIENWHLDDAQLFLDDMLFPGDARESAQQQLAECSAMQEQLYETLRTAQSAEANDDISWSISSLNGLLSIKENSVIENHPDFHQLSNHMEKLFRHVEQLLNKELDAIQDDLDFKSEEEIEAGLSELNSYLHSLNSLKLPSTIEKAVVELGKKHKQIEEDFAQKKEYLKKEIELDTAIKNNDLDRANKIHDELIAAGYSSINPDIKEKIDRLNARSKLASDMARLQSLENSHDYLMAAMLAHYLEQMTDDENQAKDHKGSYDRNIKLHRSEAQKKFDAALDSIDKHLKPDYYNLASAEKYIIEANTLKETPSASGLEEQLFRLGYKNIIIMPDQDTYAPNLSNPSLLKLEQLQDMVTKAQVNFQQAKEYVKQAHQLSSEKSSHQSLKSILERYQDAQNFYPHYPNINQLVDSAQKRRDTFRTDQLELQKRDILAKSQMISEQNHTSIQKILEQLANENYPAHLTNELQKAFDRYNQLYEIDKSQNQEFKERLFAGINRSLDLNNPNPQQVTEELTQFHTNWLEKIGKISSTNANAAKSQINQLEQKLQPIREQLIQLSNATQSGNIGHPELQIVDSLAGNDIILAFKPANGYRVLANVYLKNAKNNQIAEEDRTDSFAQAIRFAEVSNDLALKDIAVQGLKEFQKNSDYAEREAAFFDQIQSFTTSKTVQLALNEYQPQEIGERLSASKRIVQHIQQLKNQERERKVAQDLENAVEFAKKGLFSQAVHTLESSDGKEKLEFQKLHSQLKQVLAEESAEETSLQTLDINDFEAAKSLADYSSVSVLLKRLETLSKNQDSRTPQNFPNHSSDFGSYVAKLHKKWEEFKSKFKDEIETRLDNLTASITREITTLVTSELFTQNGSHLFADLERWSFFATDAQRDRIKTIRQNSNLWFSKNIAIKAAQSGFEQIKVSLKNLQEQYSQANVKFETLLQQNADVLIFQDDQLDGQKNEISKKKIALSFSSFSSDMKSKFNSVKGLVLSHSQPSSQNDWEDIERLLSQQIQDLNADMEREELAHRLFLCDVHLSHIEYKDAEREIGYLERNYKERSSNYPEEWQKILAKKQQSNAISAQENTIDNKLNELRTSFEAWLSHLCESKDLFSATLEQKHREYLAKEDACEQFLNQIRLNQSKGKFGEFWEVKQLHRSVLRCRDIDRDRVNDPKPEDTSAKFETIQKLWEALKLTRTMNAIDRYKSWLGQRINTLNAIGEFQKAWNKQQGFSILPPNLPAEATGINAIKGSSSATKSEDNQIEALLNNYAKWKQGKKRNIFGVLLGISLMILCCSGISYGFYQAAQPTPTPTPITPTVTFTPTFTPIPTDTPTPTNTPLPTATPTPDFVRSCVSLNYGVPIRQLPDKDSEVVISIPNGQRVFVLLEKNNTQSGDYRRGWAFVRYITEGGSSVQGWAYFGGGNFDASCGNTPLIIPTTIPMGSDVIQPCIVVDNLSLRDQPSDSGQLLKSLTVGNPVLVLNSNSLDSTTFREGWIKVRYQTSGDTSIEGYIPFNTGKIESACSVNPLEP